MPSPSADTVALIARVLDGATPPSGPRSVTKKATDIEALALHFWLRQRLGQPNSHCQWIKLGRASTEVIVMTPEAAQLMEPPHWAHVQKLIEMQSQDNKHLRKSDKLNTFLMLVKRLTAIFTHNII